MKILKLSLCVLLFGLIMLAFTSCEKTETVEFERSTVVTGSDRANDTYNGGCQNGTHVGDRNNVPGG